MKVAIDMITGCHIFQGCKTNGGYGRVRVKGVHWMAHRYALSVHLRRPLLEGCVVMHTCDNPACVNPEHLVEGTQKENMQDYKAKGRMVRRGPPPRIGPPVPKSIKRKAEPPKSIERVQERFRLTLEAVKSAEGTATAVAKRFNLEVSWVRKAWAGALDKHLK